MPTLRLADKAECEAAKSAIINTDYGFASWISNREVWCISVEQ